MGEVSLWGEWVSSGGEGRATLTLVAREWVIGVIGQDAVHPSRCIQSSELPTECQNEVVNWYTDLLILIGCPIIPDFLLAVLTVNCSNIVA